jgi:glycosyltransferase involved in cell wall biosynthesis
MTDRKLLVVTYHFPPSAASGAFRLLGFVRHLPRFGWRTIVVAPPRLPYEPTDEALLGRVPPETIVYSTRYPDGWLSKPVRRFFPFGVWLPLAAWRCFQAMRHHRPDAVLTSGPPHTVHLLGRHLRRLGGLPWVADFRDPWVAGNAPNMRGIVAPWESRAEQRVLDEADGIVLNSPGARELLARAYPEHVSKMVSITNGYDPENFVAHTVRPASGRVLEVVHTGEIYASRSPGPFLEAVDRLNSAALAGRSIRVRFIGKIGSRHLRDEIEEHIRRGLSAVVSLEEPVPYLQSTRAIAQADLLLLLDSPGRRAGVPAKLYEYIGAGRPILAMAEPESDVAWVLRESGLPHRVAPPRDPGAIGQALDELLREATTADRSMQSNTAHMRFTREYLAGALAKLLDDCIAHHSYVLGERMITNAAQ